MTRAKAVALTEDIIHRARQRASFRLTDTTAFEIAVKICEEADAFRVRLEAGEENLPAAHLLFAVDGSMMPDAQGWAPALGYDLSWEDCRTLQAWVVRVHRQRARLSFVESMVNLDDPEALLGFPIAQKNEATRKAPLVSIRKAAGKTPPHSEFQQEYFQSKRRPHNYRRALEQFREKLGDLEISSYSADQCWEFRNWLAETKDEKKGEPLAGKTKNNKLSAVSSLFMYAIERRHRNDNPMANVKWFPKNENRKKVRRGYEKEELEALFIKGKREKEWQKWSPLLGLYAGVRITESIQLRTEDVSNQYGVWHILIRPGKGQRVKGDRARVIPVHKELIRLGFLDCAKRALEAKREWLFEDVPLVAKRGVDFNLPHLATIMVPSQNAATQWFGRYSDACGVSDPNVDFHALRGTFITNGSQLGKNLSLRLELVGHSKGSDVHNTYIYAGASLKALKAEIDKVRYPIQIPRSP